MTVEAASPGSVPALDRALDILERLSESHEGLTLSELSAALKLPKNAVFRITQTLLARGYLSREVTSMKFRLTRKLLTISQPGWGGLSLSEAALDTMRSLRDVTRETVQLGVRRDSEGVIIEQVEGLEPLRIAVDIGLRFKLHNNAPGKLLLAFLPMSERDALLERLDLTPSTQRTITERSELRRECERIVMSGYATDFAEADEGIHCVAAPIYGSRSDEVVGTIWVSAPARRMPRDTFRTIGEQIMVAAQQVSRRIRDLS